MFKSLFKEDIIPARADKVVFFIAPMIVLAPTMTSLSVIPFSEGFIIADINVGILFILACASLSVYGIILAGWSSNSKYAFFGGIRSAAQVISYEIAMGISLASVFLMAGSVRLDDIVKAQYDYPLSMYAPHLFIGFVVFLIAAFAETNRTPFDLPEAETELVAGYLTEYSGFRYALFFLSEYVAMFIMSSIMTLCFLGGWTIPKFVTDILPFLGSVPGIFWFLMKVYFFIFLYYWVRATVPRYRFDQLMKIGWKVLIPLSLFNLLLVAFVKRFIL
jgi:NADH-quinone oxidoreductase subunit H